MTHESETETRPACNTYRMETFWDWLRLRSLLETYFSFDAKQYNRLFDSELEKVIARTSHPAYRQSLEHLRGFDWLAYISSWVRHAGYRDQREIQERTHDIVTKLLMGQLFRGYDPRIHGPMDKRFKASVANAIRNLVAKEKTRRRYLPSVPIAQEFQPGCATPDDLPAKSDPEDSKVIENFRELVRRWLGGLGLAVLDLRLEGGETKSLVATKYHHAISPCGQRATAISPAPLSPPRRLRRDTKPILSRSECIPPRCLRHGRKRAGSRSCSGVVRALYRLGYARSSSTKPPSLIARPRPTHPEQTPLHTPKARAGRNFRSVRPTRAGIVKGMGYTRVFFGMPSGSFPR